jgi:antirestriction protein ArdC
MTKREIPNTIPTNNGKVDMPALLVAALTVPGNMSQCYNRFHRYSYLNMLFVYLQTGKLEPMGTYKRWQSLGRQVTKGNKALFVNHPLFAPHKGKDGKPVINPKTGKPETRIIGFYPKATVFQLSQTEGPELVMPNLPDWNKAEALAELDVTEEPFASADGNTQGYSVERRLAINPVAANPAKTLMHELAHIVLGHTSDEGIAKYGSSRSHRGIAEFQAEATALLVCKELGIDCDESGSRAYIQTWLNGTATDYVTTDAELVDDASVRAIFAAVDKIIVAGRKRHYAAMQESETPDASKVA